MSGRPNNKVSVTTKARHGDDFYRIMGAKGGRKGTTGGFYNNHEAAVAAGKLGWLARKKRASKCSCGKWILSYRYYEIHTNLGHEARMT